MSEKTSVLLSDVTIKGNVIEKEKLMTDAKIEGDVSAEVLQTFEGSSIKGDINSSNTSIGGALKGNVKSDKIRIKSTACLLYTSPSPRDRTRSRMPSSA